MGIKHPIKEWTEVKLRHSIIDKCFPKKSVFCLIEERSRGNSQGDGKAKEFKTHDLTKYVGISKVDSY